MSPKISTVLVCSGLLALVNCTGDRKETTGEPAPVALQSAPAPARAAPTADASAAVADDGAATVAKTGGTPATVTKLVPDAAVFVAHIDIRAISGTQMWGANKQAMSADPEARKAIEALEKCNLDVDAFDSITIAGDDAQQELVIVVGNGIGKADNLRCIGDSMKDEIGEGAWKLEDRAGEHVVVIDGGERVGHMVDDDTFVVTSRDWDTTIKSMIAGQGQSAVDGSLQAAIGNTDADANIWFAARVPASAASQLAGSPAEGLAHIAGSVDLGEGLQVAIRAGTQSPEKAKALQTFLVATYGQYKGMAAMIGIPPEIAEKVRFGTAGASATAALQLTSAEVAQVKASMERLTASGAGSPPPSPPPPP